MSVSERYAGVAKVIMKKHQFKSVRGGNKAVYVYDTDSGVYRPDAETLIEELAQKQLGVFASNIAVKEVLGVVRRLNFMQPEEEFDSCESKLVVGNGVLDLNTMKLLPHSPDYMALRSVAVYYDPSADCPTIKRVLKSNLTDYDRDLFIKFLGYLLIPDNRFKRAMALVGPPDTGKTTILDMVQGMLGSDNVANESLQSLCDRSFAEFELIGKMANLKDDLLPVSVQNAEKVKELTGGYGTTKAEQKFVQKRTPFKNRSKLMFTCNAMPIPKRPDPVYCRRWIILEMHKKFHFGELATTDRADTTLGSQFLGELSGLLNLALEGRELVIASNGFPEMSDEMATMRYMAFTGDTLGRFISDRVRPDINGAVKKGVAYGEYITFCAKASEPSKSDEEFSKMLKAVIPTVIDGWIGHDRAWRGISLRDAGDVFIQPRFTVQLNPSSFEDSDY